MKFKKLSENAIKPTRAHENDAGLDLYAAHSEMIPPGECKLIKTDIAIELPSHIFAMVCSRSGLALKHRVSVLNSPGIIDTQYRGNIGVILFNNGDDGYKVYPGDRIAQLVIAPCFILDLNEVDTLTETIRGEGGFGSSGEN